MDKRVEETPTLEPFGHSEPLTLGVELELQLVGAAQYFCILSGCRKRNRRSEA